MNPFLGQKAQQQQNKPKSK